MSSKPSTGKSCEKYCGKACMFVDNVAPYASALQAAVYTAAFAAYNTKKDFAITGLEKALVFGVTAESAANALFQFTTVQSKDSAERRIVGRHNFFSGLASVAIGLFLLFRVKDSGFPKWIIWSAVVLGGANAAIYSCSLCKCHE